MKSSKVIWIVAVVLVFGIAVAAVAVSKSSRGPVAVDDVLARPGQLVGENLTVVAEASVERAPVFGQRAWKLSGTDREALYIGTHAPNKVDGRWVAEVSVVDVDIFGQTHLVLIEQGGAMNVLERLRGLLPGARSAGYPASEAIGGDSIVIAGCVETAGEVLGLGIMALEVDGATVQVVSSGHVPPEGATVLVEGRERMVLAGTPFATTVIETRNISTPINELKSSPAVYNGEEVRVVGTITSSYSLFGRSVYGVQDQSGAEIEVWSSGAGHAPGSEVAVVGSVRHVAGWGRHQIVVLVEKSDQGTEVCPEVGAVELRDEPAIVEEHEDEAVIAEEAAEPGCIEE